MHYPYPQLYYIITEYVHFFSGLKAVVSETLKECF